MSVTCLTVSPTEVLLKDVKELLTCCCCHEAPMLPPVETCRLGHCLCTTCRILRKSCNVCLEPLSGRNLPLEKTLLSLLQYVPKDVIVHKDDETAKEEEDQKKEDLNPTSTDSFREAAEYMARIVDRDCKSHLITSGRTFPCPLPCSVMITGPGLYRHFGFQHPEVFIGQMFKNRPFSIYIPCEHLEQLNEQSPTRCLYFLIVRIGDEEYKEENNLANIKTIRAAELLSLSHNMTHMLQQRSYLALLSIHRLNDPDVYSLWITALYNFAPVTYTLSYNNSFDSVTYHGQPASLHEPSPVDKMGGCLRLTASMVRRQLQLHPTYLELTLFFHLELPFPQVLPDVPDAPVNKLVDL